MTDRPSTTQQDTRDVARQEKEQVKGTAKDAASKIGDTAAQRGQELQGQARTHARGLARSAQRQLRGHAEEETRRAGTALGVAGDQLRALADGRIDEAGVFGDYVEQAADAVNRWANTIDDRGFDGLLDDLRSVGRRRPGMFLGGALLAGALVGRFGRNVAQELGDDEETLSTTTTMDDASNVGTTSARGLGPTGPDDVVPQGTDPDLTQGGRADDMIVGHASDDRGVVVDPADRSSDEISSERPVPPPDELADEDLGYRSIDVDQGRRR